jgi:hypothetical protein
MGAYRSLLTSLLPKPQSSDERLIVVGDLFADFDAGHQALLDAYLWLSAWGDRAHILFGNHDVSADRTKMSSLDLLGFFMPQLNIVSEPTLDSATGIAFVPHVVNQQEFDNVLAEAAGEADILITHANYENVFAAEQEHSLNMTVQQCQKFKMVLTGHEHVPRSPENVHVLGSVLPCNIGEAVSDHFIYRWDGSATSVPLPQTTWERRHYEEQDWRSLDPNTSAQFVRVIGEATADEAALVLQEFSKFRALHNAFMISNKVTVGGLEIGEIQEGVEALDSFDPLAVLKEILSAKSRKKLEEVESEQRRSNGRG